VDFNAEKFMTDILHDKVTPESTPAEQEKPGDWKEGEGAAGTEATSTDPTAKDTEGAPAEGEAGTGKQDPADGEPPSPEVAERWQEGMAAMKELVERSQTDPYGEDELDAALEEIRTEYEFTELDAERTGEDWKVHAEMNPKGDFKVEGEEGPLPGSPDEFTDESLWEEVAGQVAPEETGTPQAKLSERSESFGLKVLLEYIARSPASEPERQEARTEVMASVREAMAETDGDQIYYRLRDAASVVNGLYPPEAEVQLQVHHEERVSANPATFAQTRGQRIRQRIARRINNDVANLSAEERAIAERTDPDERRALIRELAQRELEEDIEEGPPPLEEVEMDVMPREAHLGRVHGRHED
jgi:hypothetical protein